MKTIVAVAGASASGKTSLAEQLVEQFPDIFDRWTQVTTRPSRGPGDNYLFLSESKYDAIHGLLTAKTMFNGYRYGTMPSPTQAPYILIVVNAEGLKDLIYDINYDSERKVFDEPVRLITIRMEFDVNEATMAARGRLGRLDGIVDEISALDALNVEWDIEIDTTSQWPDTEAVIAQLQRNVNSYEAGAKFGAFLNFAENLHQGHPAIAELIAIMEKYTVESDSGSTDSVYAVEVANDDIDAILGSDFVSETEEVSMIQPEEPVNIEVTEEITVTPAVEPTVIAATSDVVEMQITQEADRELKEMELQSAATEPKVAERATVDAVAEESATAINYAQLFSSAEMLFTDYLLTEFDGFEIGFFSNKNAVSTQFKQWVAGLAGVDSSKIAIETNIQETTAGVGGGKLTLIIVNAEGCLDPIYLIEFNHRLGRVINEDYIK